MAGQLGGVFCFRGAIKLFGCGESLRQRGRDRGGGFSAFEKAGPDKPADADRRDQHGRDDADEPAFALFLRLRRSAAAGRLPLGRLLLPLGLLLPGRLLRLLAGLPLLLNRLPLLRLLLLPGARLCRLGLLSVAWLCRPGLLPGARLRLLRSGGCGLDGRGRSRGGRCGHEGDLRTAIGAEFRAIRQLAAAFGTKHAFSSFSEIRWNPGVPPPCTNIYSVDFKASAM